jgi:hydrogenase maturation protein HypF
MTAATSESNESAKIRKNFRVKGTVQGVGFRPFVFRLAHELQLGGWVANTLWGAEIEVEGAVSHVQCFEQRLRSELPPLATISSLEITDLEPVGVTDFVIRASDAGGTPAALVLPDVATCPDCLREIFDPTNRRFRYPFTNCTNCGPRYSIIVRLPYDRANTTMASFVMCEECRAEYEDPRNRRFHAQPNACPKCGPQLAWLDARGQELQRADEALLAATRALREGAVVALKGIGGFQLLVDARSEDAVRRLRARKRREEKPLALMLPSLAAAQCSCEINEVEQQLLTSAESPIVLLRKRGSADLGIAPSVAPGNPYLGVMLPYSPLHHLLLADFQAPLVVTSGNLTDEPICISTEEALERLSGIADFFLTHNRPIVRYVDDSVVRVVKGRAVVLRRARGYAPLPVAQLPTSADGVLAFGAHLKNTIALGVGENLILSQHIGDLDTEPALRAHEHTARALAALYEAQPRHLACDLHPDYASSRVARKWRANSQTLIEVPHHYAHVLAVMAEHELLEEDVLGVAWDGTGLGLDRAIWGSEFLLASARAFQRLGHFRYFRALGGDRAMREPRRAALAILAEILGAEDAVKWFVKHHPNAFSPQELPIILKMLATGLNSPWTSSAGRMFDAVAALLGMRYRCSFEGQAAMELEWCATEVPGDDHYLVAWRSAQAEPGHVFWPDGLGTASPVPIQVFDWEPMVRAILTEYESGVVPQRIARRFHATLALLITQMAHHSSRQMVVLSGGCFQNRLLCELAAERLEQEGFRVFINEQIPPNDGGIAVGQAVAAALHAAKENHPCA